MGFSQPKIPAQPPPAPTAPSLPAILSNQQRMKFGSGVGSLGGTFLTGPQGNPLGNTPGSMGQTEKKSLLGS